jgi:hypothetical protein
MTDAKKKLSGKKRAGAVSNPTNPKNVSRRTIDAQRAVDLRIAGFSFDAIAEQLGVARETARRAVLETLDTVAYQNATHMRAQEGQRLDVMQRAVWADVLTGDVKAVNAAVRIMERRSRLFGLDAPIEIKASVSDDTHRESLTNRLNDMRQRVLDAESYEIEAGTDESATG